MHRIELVSSDKIIKDSSTTINIQNSKLANGKLKIILPFLFILAFIFIRLFIAFYKKQSQRAIPINA
jgi:preprotein translocase subunit SecY